MVASGEPILGVFAERHHAAMLEVMTRRYYRIRPLEHVRVAEHDGRPLLTADYVHDGQAYTLLATVALRPARPAGRRDRPRSRPTCASWSMRCRRSGPRWSTSTSRPPRRPAPTRTPRPGGFATCSAASRERSTGSRSRSGTPDGDGSGMTTWFTFRGGPERRAGGGPHAARPAPDGRRAAGPVAAVGIRADPAALGHRRAPVPRAGPRSPRRPAAHRARRRPRPDHLARRRRAASAACRSSSTRSTPAWTACARPARPTGPWRSWSGTGSSSTSGQSSTFRSPSSTRSSGHSPPAPRRSAWSRCWCSSGEPIPATRTPSPASGCCGCPARRAPG